MITSLALLLAAHALAAEPLPLRAGTQQVQTDHGAFTLNVEPGALVVRDAIHAARRHGPPIDSEMASRCQSHPPVEISVDEFERQSAEMFAKDPRASRMFEILNTGDIVGLYKWRGVNCQAYQIWYLPVSGQLPAEMRLSRGQLGGETVLCLQMFNAEKKETERFVVKAFDYFKDKPDPNFHSQCGPFVGS